MRKTYVLAFLSQSPEGSADDFHLEPNETFLEPNEMSQSTEGSADDFHLSFPCSGTNNAFVSIPRRVRRRFPRP